MNDLMKISVTNLYFPSKIGPFNILPMTETTNKKLRRMEVIFYAAVSFFTHLRRFTQLRKFTQQSHHWFS